MANFLLVAAKPILAAGFLISVLFCGAPMAPVFLACLIIGRTMGEPERGRCKALTLNTSIPNVPAVMVAASTGFAATAAPMAVLL